MNFKFLPLLILAITPSVRILAQASGFCPGQITNGYVVDFVEYHGQLYATGLFTRICDKVTSPVARYDGNQWNSVANNSGGSLDAGHSLAVIQDQLYVAKYEWSSDSNWLLRMDNDFKLRKLLPGFWRTNPNPNLSQVPILYDVVEFQGHIVVSGEFNRAGNQAINGIAAYNGSGWTPLSTGLTGYLPNTYSLIAPHGMFVWNDNLYVAGNFLKAGDVVVNGVGRWDGTQWHAMGQGFNKAAYGFGVLNDTLYACGEFTASGNNTLGGIAKWDGTQWVSPGFKLAQGNSAGYWYVHTLQEIDGKLFILGGFNKVHTATDTLDCSSIVAFDGSAVDVMGGGIPNVDSEAIIPYGQGILIGGGIINGSSGHLHYYSGSVPVKDIPVRQSFTVSPNPASDVVYLRTQDDRKVQYAWYDLLGQLLDSGEAYGPEIVCHTGKWKPGVYFVKVSVDGETPVVQTVVKE